MSKRKYHGSAMPRQGVFTGEENIPEEEEEKRKEKPEKTNGED